ncbi:TPA: phage antirepressor N-terminal domain-containing protein [Serratia marcescens]
MTNSISVSFHGSELFVVNHNGDPLVPMRPIVEGMGMDWASQFTKIKQRFASTVVEITTQLPGDKQRRKVTCLPLRKLAGWLQTISPNKVRPEIRDTVIQYQEECDDVLYEYWTTGQVARKPETTVDDRTPLRGIVNRIMGKYGMTYQAVYKLVHKEFGVNHIDELTPKQTAEAIEYLATKAIEGEFLGKQPELVNFDFEMYVHNANVVCIHLEYIRQIWKQELHPALRLIGSPLAVKLYDRIIDAGAISYGIRHGLEKASGLKGLQH